MKLTQIILIIVLQLLIVSAISATVSKAKKAAKNGKIAMKIKHSQEDDQAQEGDEVEEEVVLNEEQEEEEEEEEQFADGPDVFQVYKSNPDVKHSLFKYANGHDRVSGSLESVPQRDRSGYREVSKLDYTAFKIVKFYSYLFNEIDLDQDNRISRQELIDAFEKFNWSKPEDQTVENYVNENVSEDGLTLSQFITFQKTLATMSEESQTKVLKQQNVKMLFP